MTMDIPDSDNKSSASCRGVVAFGGNLDLLIITVASFAVLAEFTSMQCSVSTYCSIVTKVLPRI